MDVRKASVAQFSSRITCAKEYSVNGMEPRDKSLESGEAGGRSQSGLGAISSPDL